MATFLKPQRVPRVAVEDTAAIATVRGKWIPRPNDDTVFGQIKGIALVGPTTKFYRTSYTVGGTSSPQPTREEIHLASLAPTFSRKHLPLKIPFERSGSTGYTARAPQLTPARAPAPLAASMPTLGPAGLGKRGLDGTVGGMAAVKKGRTGGDGGGEDGGDDEELLLAPMVSRMSCKRATVAMDDVVMEG